RIVFECPTFDFGLSSRSLLRKMGEISKEEKMEELAEKCFMLAGSASTAKELMLKFIEIRPELGEKGMKVHVHNFSHKTDYSRYTRSEEHTSELQSRFDLVCRLLLEKKKN